MEKSMTLHYVYVILLGLTFIGNLSGPVLEFITMGPSLYLVGYCVFVLYSGFLFYAAYQLKRCLIPLLWVQFISACLWTVLSFFYLTNLGVFLSDFFGVEAIATVIVVSGFLVNVFSLIFCYLIIVYYKRRRHLLN